MRVTSYTQDGKPGETLVAAPLLDITTVRHSLAFRTAGFDYEVERAGSLEKVVVAQS